jgi:hypothetical protein
LRYKEAGKKGNYAKFIEDSNLNWSVDHAKIKKIFNQKYREQHAQYTSIVFFNHIFSLFFSLEFFTHICHMRIGI